MDVFVNIGKFLDHFLFLCILNYYQSCKQTYKITCIEYRKPNLEILMTYRPMLLFNYDSLLECQLSMLTAVCFKHNILATYTKMFITLHK